MLRVTRPILLSASVVALLMAGACEDQQAKVARAAAAQTAGMRVIGPNDLQIVSADGSVAIEVLGDTVHVMTTTSRVSVPATYLEHVKYAGGRLSFDVKGVGAQIFDVGDGTNGAAISSEQALAFVSLIVQKQNEQAPARTP